MSVYLCFQEDRQPTDLDVVGVKLGTPTDPFSTVQNMAQFSSARNGQLPPLDREMSDVPSQVKVGLATYHLKPCIYHLLSLFLKFSILSFIK